MPIQKIVGGIGNIATGFGAAIGGAVAALATGTIVGLVSFVVAKIKLANQRSAMQSLDVDPERLRNWQAARHAGFDRMRLDPEFTAVLKKQAGIQGAETAANPTLSPLCVEIFNDYISLGTKGNFLGLTGSLLDVYREVNFGIMDYLNQQRALEWDSTTGRYTLVPNIVTKGGKNKLSAGCVAMVMFGNEQALLILRLTQVANRVAITDTAKKKKFAEMKSILGAVKLSIMDAFAYDPKNPQQSGLARVHKTAIGRIVKSIGRIAGIVNGREASLQEIYDDLLAQQAAHQQGKQYHSRLDELFDRIMAEAEKKNELTFAEELSLSIYQGANAGLQGVVMAGQTEDSKRLGPPVPAQIYRGGRVATGVATKKARKQVAITQNERMWAYLMHAVGDEHGNVVAMPAGDPTFKAVGWLSREHNPLRRKRSGDYVAPEAAKQAMMKWSHIVYLKTLITKLTSAYQEEIMHGQGARSPVAIYFLQQLDIGLSQIQQLHAELAGTELFTQMINRDLAHYQRTHHKRPTRPELVVKLGITSEYAATREIDITGAFDARTANADATAQTHSPTAAEAAAEEKVINRRRNNLEAIVTAPSATYSSTLTKDIAWHQYLHQLVQQKLAVTKVDNTLSLDMDRWEATSDRAAAVSLMASVLATPVGSEASGPGFQAFKQDVQGWQEAFHAYAAAEPNSKVKAIAQQHAALIKTYGNVTKQAQHALLVQNHMLALLYEYDRATYDRIARAITKSLKEQLIIQFHENDAGVLQLRFAEHRLVDNLDYHVLANTMFVLYNKFNKEIPMPYADKAVYKAVKASMQTASAEDQAMFALEDRKLSLIQRIRHNVTLLKASKTALPTMTAKECKALVKQKTAVIQKQYTDMEGRIDTLTKRLVDIETEKDELQTQYDQLLYEKETTEAEALKHLQKIREITEKQKALKGQESELTEIIATLRTESKTLEDQLVKTRATFAEYKKLSQGMVKRLIEEKSERLTAAVKACDEELISVEKELAEIEKHKQKAAATNEQAKQQVSDSLTRALYEGLESIEQEYVKRNNGSPLGLEAFRQKIEKKFISTEIDDAFALTAMQSQKALSDWQSRLDKRKGALEKRLEEVNKQLAELELDKAEYANLIASGKKVDESFATNSELIQLLQQRHATLQEKYEKSQQESAQYQTALENQIKQLETLISTRVALYSAKDSMAVERLGAAVPTIALSKRVTKVYDEKQEVVGLYLEKLNAALMRMKVNKGNGVTLDFVGDSVRLKAMNALVKAFAVALKHRDWFLPEWAGIAKSATNLAEAMLPKARFKRQALVKQLGLYIRDLKNTFETVFEGTEIDYKPPASFRILEHSMKALVGDEDEGEQQAAKHHKLKRRARLLTGHQLARIMKDIVTMQYMIRHGGAKPSFTGGGRLTTAEDWKNFAESFDLPRSVVTGLATRTGATLDVAQMAKLVDQDAANKEKPAQVVAYTTDGEPSGKPQETIAAVDDEDTSAKLQVEGEATPTSPTPTSTH